MRCCRSLVGYVKSDGEYIGLYILNKEGRDYMKSFWDYINDNGGEVMEEVIDGLDTAIETINDIINV